MVLCYSRHLVYTNASSPFPKSFEHLERLIASARLYRKSRMRFVYLLRDSYRYYKQGFGSVKRDYFNGQKHKIYFKWKLRGKYLLYLSITVYLKSNKD